MITSTSNIQVKELLRLQKKSREREKEGVFIVEGPRMAEEIPRERIVKLYVSESCQAKCVKENNGRNMRLSINRSVYSSCGWDVGYGICACVGHEDSAGNPCRRTPDGVYGGRYFRGDSACARS